MNQRLPSISLYLLLIFLIVLVAIVAIQQDQESQTKSTPWITPVITTLTPTPTAAGGWWSELPSPTPKP